ncbi:MAG: hypothetical protein EP297_01940 [Gammaproteobacteria bacterium]|nr:MAG: hypothetical protein EP297_01940 [Gammaproteobacteria bacterium]
MKNITSPRFALIISLILIAAVARIVLSTTPNVSPIAAAALFSGAYLADRKTAFLIPLAALFIGDLVIGLHATMPFVYAAFALTVLIGMWLSRHLCGHLLIAVTMVSSTLFFLITNFGVWATTDYYTHDLAGLITCYIAAIPFFQYTLIGDLFFVSLIFGVFMAVETLVPSVRKSSAQTVAQ